MSRSVSPSPPPPPLTRRDFVRRAGQYGGGSAFAAMMALGLLAKEGTPAARAKEPPAPTPTPTPGDGKPPALTNNGDRKTRVLILGAGLCGMATAYELGKLGFDCEIFEARARAGGRVWTVRGGDRAIEHGVSGAGGGGDTVQMARFRPGHYMNAGPARIPGHHTTTLGYCRELGVPIEVFSNVNESAFYHTDALGRVRMREARADLRGYVDELLAKAVSRDALDRPLTRDDKEAVLDYLRADGDLNRELLYRPNTAGTGPGGLPLRNDTFDARGYLYEDLPAAGSHPGRHSDPLGFEAVLRAGFGRHLFFERQFNQQPTMFQAVGGMDTITAAFEKQVGDRIRYRHEVREMRRVSPSAGGGVRVIVADLAAGDNAAATREVAGDYCICTIPLSVLRGIPADFSAPVREAVAAVPYMQTGKIGLQFKRRFWEEDDRIYGGISWTDQNITQIMYPNCGYLGGDGGLLIGYYHFERDAEEVGKLPPAEREAHALAQGAKLHPQYPDEFESAFSVSWNHVPYSLGGWAVWNEEMRAKYYPVLNRPDGPFYFAGEHLTYLGGWMAGAFESAKSVVSALKEKAKG